MQQLAALLRALRSVVIGYSGGVDSVFLAVTAVDVLGAERVLAVTGVSAAYPASHHDIALRCARDFGVPHTEIATDELADPNYTSNPSNRCYYCKTELWSRLVQLAEERGYAAVLDGANADDASDHRPGLLAAREHAVRSPLLEVGLTKAEIRTLSRARGLPTWDQPASPCLSSRIPYGLAVTPQRLRAIEAAEMALLALGFPGTRVRHHGDVARLELAPSDLERAYELRDRITGAMRSAGFERSVLDVEGYRRGALNEGIELIQLSAS
jgi:uncharacterized protein